MNPIVYTATKMAMKELTREELTTMNLCVLLGSNPVGRLGYDKIKTLFTEAGGTQMHAETKEAFLTISDLML